MKRILIIALISIIAMTNAMAQSMSDSKIIEFVQKEQKKGTSQAQIVTKLMQKGVSVTKLQQLRKKYSKMQNGSLGAASTPGENTDNRSRTANGIHSAADRAQRERAPLAVMSSIRSLAAAWMAGMMMSTAWMTVWMHSTISCRTL